MPPNTQTGYRISLFLKKERKGTGLKISREVAFMAAHCFKNGELRIGLRLQVEDGPVAKVADFNHASDLVLLALDDTSSPLGGWAYGGKCRRGDAWQAVPYTSPKPLLGHVLDPRAVYHEDDDLTVKALRLQCRQPINERTHYAGSPVEPHGRTAPSVVLGLMVKPWNRPVGDDEAFAISVKEAMAIFGLLMPSGAARRSTNHASANGDSGSGPALGVWWTVQSRRPSNRGGS